VLYGKSNTVRIAGVEVSDTNKHWFERQSKKFAI
jgi:hypothetical protein